MCWNFYEKLQAAKQIHCIGEQLYFSKMLVLEMYCLFYVTHMNNMWYVYILMV
jgi:hypothetical protein